MSLPFTADLNTCDREPTHIPQAIQPHGLYLSVCTESGRIEALSDTCARIFKRPTAEILGCHIEAALGSANAQAIGSMLGAPNERAGQAWSITLGTGAEESLWEATSHHLAGNTVIELEHFMRQDELNQFLHGAITQLRDTYDLPSPCARAAQLVRQITRFDRVVVYRFDHEGHGVVIAEDRDATVSALLGLHFPASDIPQQARRMYARNHQRAIPVVHYEPSAILTADSAQASGPIDLTQAILRSVSPVHREYMQNMGLHASMSVSLMHQDRLWGLFSCSHEHGPHPLPFSVRATCESLGAITAMLIESKERNDDSEYKLRLKVQQSILLQRITQAANFT